MPRILWPIGLLAASLALNLGTGCGVPFAAFACVVALTVPPRLAAATLAAIWAANEGAFLLVLHMPATWQSLAWAGVLAGDAALCLGAAWAGQGSAGAAFGLAFCAYQGGLFAGALLLGGTRYFTPHLVLAQLLQNAAAAAALLLAASALGLWRASLPRVQWGRKKGLV